MALNSQQKRMAVPGAGRPWLRAVYPSALKDKPWRASVGNVYPVADFEAEAVPEDIYIQDVYVVIEENITTVEASSNDIQYVESVTTNTIVVKEDICVIVEVRDT